MVLPSWDHDDDTLDNDYISYNGLRRDVRDYIGVLDFTANIHANHENASGVSVDPQVQELVDRIRDLTRKDLLTPAAPSPRIASPAEPFPGVVGESLSWGASPPSGGGASPETGGFRRPPCPLQREGESLCATTGFLGPTSSRSVLLRSRRAWLPVTGEYASTTTTTRLFRNVSSRVR